MVEEDIFSPKILKLEGEIIEFLSKSPLLFTKDPFVNQIRARFFTRKQLTQKELQKLTQLSTGKISQVLKTLIKWRLIEKSSVSSTGEFTYSMDSIERSCRTYFHTIIEEMTQSIKPLEEIKEILEQEGDKIKNLRGYDKISYLVPLFLQAIKVNIEIMKDFEGVDLEET
ncbi:MAG: hypothetical protein ACFFAA_06020 [Promethearchaeota archaeon]